MKVTTEVMINGRVVDLELDSQGIKLYSDRDCETVYLCKGETVVASIQLEAYSGEGGGGSLRVTKHG